MDSPGSAARKPHTPPCLSALASYFLRLGATGFGGPVALCGLMERDLVERRGWLSRTELRDMIAVCQLMPGPLAVQVGIFVGYRRCGVWGAWVAGGALILPAFVMMTALAAAYANLGDLPWVTAVVYGMNLAVIALILQSWWRLARLGMEDRFQSALAAGGFLATFVLAGQLPALFLAAGAAGSVWYSARPRGTAPLAVAASPWPLGKLAGFFFVTGSVSFGSALAVVPLLENGLVQHGRWLTSHDFLVAVAAGMITPGPIMTVAGFAGYLVAGLPGAVLCTVAVFLPWFLLVLLMRAVPAAVSRAAGGAGGPEGRVRRGDRRDPGGGGAAGARGDRGLGDGADRGRGAGGVDAVPDRESGAGEDRGGDRAGGFSVGASGVGVGAVGGGGSRGGRLDRWTSRTKIAETKDWSGAGNCQVITVSVQTAATGSWPLKLTVVRRNRAGPVLLVAQTPYFKED